MKTSVIRKEPIKPPIESVTLTLTEKEAEFLHYIMSQHSFASGLAVNDFHENMINFFQANKIIPRGL